MVCCGDDHQCKTKTAMAGMENKRVFDQMCGGAAHLDIDFIAKDIDGAFDGDIMSVFTSSGLQPQPVMLWGQAMPSQPLIFLPAAIGALVGSLAGGAVAFVYARHRAILAP